jgi:predicted phosphodiesterase
MRYLLLSDLHANLEALREALGYARGLAYDHVLVLGDVVGYGPDPNAVVEMVRSLPGLAAIRGNHDKVAVGLEEGDDFNDAARVAALWTRSVLEPGNLAFLGSLPRGPLEFAPGRYLAHGTPHDEDRYLLDEGEARRSFASLPFDLCFFGHSHYPCAFTLEGGRVGFQLAQAEPTVFTLVEGVRYLINPGSLGQPRDRNPRASFALYDAGEETVTVHRVAYPLETTRDKIRAAGLPPALGERLRLGV